jgi:hypothetical protein
MPPDPCPQETPPDAPGRSYVMWCGECGLIQMCPIGDAWRYAREGWPRCCGEVMYYGPAGDAAADEEIPPG